MIEIRPKNIKKWITKYFNYGRHTTIFYDNETLSIMSVGGQRYSLITIFGYKFKLINHEWMNNE